MYGPPFTDHGPHYVMDPIEGLDVLSPHADDPDLRAVEAELHGQAPSGEKVAAVIRDTFDQLYDGQHTGRYDVVQLH